MPIQALSAEGIDAYARVLSFISTTIEMQFLYFHDVPSLLREAHVWAVTLASVAVGTVHLVERRGRAKCELNPQRQIEIGTLIESMPEAVFVFDQRGQMMEVNSGAERMFGARREQMKQRSCGDVCDFLRSWGETPDGASAVVGRALAGETLQQERRKLDLPAQGRSLEVLVSASPIRDGGNVIVGALVIVRDITELTVLQQKIGDAERHTAIGKMTASLAHDFNNVLDTIGQAVSVMEVDPNRPPEERQLVTRMIRNAVKRGAEMVAGMRKYLIGRGEGQDLIDMNDVLEESLELTRPLWQSAKSISIQRRYQPVRKVNANANELRRVFTNLIINSIEAMPAGGALTLGCEQDGKRVIAFVEDTGEGIPEDKKRHIFSPYFTTKEGGTGLGLSSAENAVKAQRGRIMFDSRVGEGTRFCVELPAAEAPHAGEEEERKTA